MKNCSHLAGEDFGSKRRLYGKIPVVKFAHENPLNVPQGTEYIMLKIKFRFFNSYTHLNVRSLR